MINDEHELDEFEDMWTTDKDVYWLVKLPDGSGYSIIEIMPNSIGSLIIEDDDIYQKVITKMLEMGNKRITQEYLHQMIRESISKPNNLTS